MAKQVLSDCAILLGGYNLTGDMNAVALEYGAALADGTTFAAGTEGFLAGLKKARATANGLFNAGVGNVDEVLFSKIGIDDEILTIAPITGADGETAFSFRAGLGEYAPAAGIGDAFAFSLAAETTSAPLVHGTIMHNSARTVTGTGTARQLGAVSASQKVYAALHVLAVSGTAPTLDVTVRSDVVVGMTTSATQLTFAQATAIGGQWRQLAGPVADDWWDVAFTIGGISPSFLFALIIGIEEG